MLPFAKSIFARLAIKIIEIFLGFESWCITIKTIKSIGKNCNIEYLISTLGLANITIGDNFNVRKNFKLRVYCTPLNWTNFLWV